MALNSRYTPNELIIIMAQMSFNNPNIKLISFSKAVNSDSTTPNYFYHFKNLKTHEHFILACPAYDKKSSNPLKNVGMSHLTAVIDFINRTIVDEKSFPPIIKIFIPLAETYKRNHWTLFIRTIDNQGQPPKASQQLYDPKGKRPLLGYNYSSLQSALGIRENNLDVYYTQLQSMLNGEDCGPITALIFYCFINGIDLNCLSLTSADTLRPWFENSFYQPALKNSEIYFAAEDTGVDCQLSTAAPIVVVNDDFFAPIQQGHETPIFGSP